MRYISLLLITMLFFNYSIASKKTSPTLFIQKYDSLAITLSNEYKIPPSVILGISILESGSGTSKLSITKHNYFGIKKGHSYRGYDNDTLSFNHFCTYVSSRKYYNKMISNNSNDYIKWTYKIQSGGYSQNKKWSALVINIIKKYKLYELDN